MSNTQTIKHNIRGYHVDLYAVPGNAPHGFEVTRDDTTNISGYYSTGCLQIEHGELVDYDGVMCLPLCVADALASIGVIVDDNCLSDAAAAERAARE